MKASENSSAARADEEEEEIEKGRRRKGEMWIGMEMEVKMEMEMERQRKREHGAEVPRSPGGGLLRIVSYDNSVGQMCDWEKGSKKEQTTTERARCDEPRITHRPLPCRQLKHVLV